MASSPRKSVWPFRRTTRTTRNTRSDKSPSQENLTAVSVLENDEPPLVVSLESFENDDDDDQPPDVQNNRPSSASVGSDEAERGSLQSRASGEDNVSALSRASENEEHMEGEDEEVDPRVKGQIESLNQAIDDVNRLENEYQDAAKQYNHLAVQKQQELEAVYASCASSVEILRPFYEAKKQSEEAMQVAEGLMQNYKLALGEREVAKEALELMEQEIAERHQVLVRKGPDGMGLDLISHKIVKIHAGSSAEQDGLLKVGDAVLAVEGKALGGRKLGEVLQEFEPDKVEFVLSISRTRKQDNLENEGHAEVTRHLREKLQTATRNAAETQKKYKAQRRTADRLHNKFDRLSKKLHSRGSYDKHIGKYSLYDQTKDKIMGDVDVAHKQLEALETEKAAAAEHVTEAMSSLESISDEIHARREQNRYTSGVSMSSWGKRYQSEGDLADPSEDKRTASELNSIERRNTHA